MKKKISAFLGPTNTGKTYKAIQSLLKHKTGVIGFPLRLLARENFELAKKLSSKGFQLNTHAIGDKANEIVLDVYNYILKDIEDHEDEKDLWWNQSPVECLSKCFR